MWSRARALSRVRVRQRRDTGDARLPADSQSKEVASRLVPWQRASEEHTQREREKKTDANTDDLVFFSPSTFLQCVLGGNATPSAGDVEKILSSVGAEADKDQLSKLMSELDGKDITEVIAAGSEKLASVPAGGAVAASGGAAGGAAPAEEEKEESEEEESDDDMGFSLFD